MNLLAFYAFLRVGEITKTSGSNHHYLLRKHLKFVCNPQREDYLELTIPHYKHSINVATLNIKKNTAQPALCPLKACQAYLLIRSHFSIEEPLFSFMDGTPISRQFFTENLQQSLAFCGLDTHQYHSHSFRIGAATTAASSGSSEVSSIWAGGSLWHLKNISEFQPFSCNVIYLLVIQFDRSLTSSCHQYFVFFRVTYVT